MPGIGPYPYPLAARREPTIEDKLAAIRSKYPYAQLPPDFGSNPADAVALDRLASPVPEWMQKAGSKISDFFGGNKPNSNEMMSRVGSMKGSGGRSMSDAQYRGALQAGRLLVEHAVPGGLSGRTGQMFTRANQLYNTEIKGIGMSARNALSAKSMLGDVVEMSGYMPTQDGGYVSRSNIDPAIVRAIYAEAEMTGVNPALLAQERLPIYQAAASPEVQEMLASQRDYDTPIWQNDEGVVISPRDFEEGPNAMSGKVMRYVPKFMEQNDKA
jgi:hypothetical protein